MADFIALVEAGPRAGHGGRARLRAAGRARPPVGDRRTRSGSPPSPTARSPTPRTRRRSTRTSIRSTSTTTPRASTPSACASSRCWIDAGVTIFRVDNPHTKPINFWQWLIAAVKKDHPDVLFLAEAFTRPAMMHELAKVGFTQSYTYFTWRNAKAELEEYVDELVESADYMRPNFFVNTPDILHEYLQQAGPAAFAIRAVLAAMLSPTWGVYSGYELFEHAAGAAGQRGVPRLGEVPAAPARLRRRARRRPLARAAAAQLNAIRRDHPALHAAAQPAPPRGSTTTPSLCFSKRDPSTGDTVLVGVQHRPARVARGRLDVARPAGAGPDWDARLDVRDLLDRRGVTTGASTTTSVSTRSSPAHIFAVEPAAAPPMPCHTRQRTPDEPQSTVRRAPTRPGVVQARRLLRGPRAGVRRLQRRRHRRPARAGRQARLPGVARHRLPVAAAVLPLAAARRRLRRQRLHRRAARVRHHRRLHALARRRPRSAACG